MFKRIVISLGLLACITCLIQAQEEDVVLGKKRSEWLKLLKESKNPKARQGSLLALAVIGPKEGVVNGILEALSKDADANVRREAINVLTGMGKEAKGAVDALGEALQKDKSEIVREAAARSLAKFGPQAESQVLILASALEDKHAGTRAAAAETLNELGEKARPALPKLLKVLSNKDSDHFTRTYAALILVKISDEPRKLVPALTGGAEDRYGARAQTVEQHLLGNNDRGVRERDRIGAGTPQDNSGSDSRKISKEILMPECVHD